METPRGYGHSKREQSDAIWWLVVIIGLAVFGGPVLMMLMR